VVPPAFSFSGGWDGVREGGGLGKRRADVHRVARSRVCSPAVVVGGARFSRGDVPLRLAFRGGVDEAKAAASRGIMLHLLLALMVLHSGATGEVGSYCTGVRA